MFRYLHSNPVANSQRILREVLDTLEEKLYKPTACPADAEKIERYIETKVDGNLKKPVSYTHLTLPTNSLV